VNGEWFWMALLRNAFYIEIVAEGDPKNTNDE